MDDLAGLMRDQDGVVARQQALDLGETPLSIARLLRRGEWVKVHPGVYIDHNGPLTWQQRAWAAVLSVAPAALCLESAMRAEEGPGGKHNDGGVIHVAVARNRSVVGPPGVVTLRMTGFEERVQTHKRPPRIHYEDTVLDLAARADSRVRAVAILADACGSRRTTAERLLTRLDARKRVERRPWLRAVLSDVALGTCSVLEHGYLDLVERPHGLPAGSRQAVRQGTNGNVYRDIDLPQLGMVVELVGRLFHSSTADWNADLERDLDAAVDNVEVTVRLGFAQVYEHGCRTAVKVAKVMQRLGWDEEPQRCERCPE